MKIGANVSTAGGISNAIARAQEIGCEAIQIFGSSPQTWAFKPVPGEQIELFKQRLADAGPGSANVAAVHANDSKRVCGSGVDRHDNIGEGFIGEDGFAAIMGHPAFAEVPFLLEVPGFEGKGPDRQNIDILKKIRQQVGLSH